MRSPKHAHHAPATSPFPIPPNSHSPTLPSLPSLPSIPELMDRTFTAVSDMQQRSTRNTNSMLSELEQICSTQQAKLEKRLARKVLHFREDVTADVRNPESFDDNGDNVDKVNKQDINLPDGHDSSSISRKGKIVALSTLGAGTLMAMLNGLTDVIKELGPHWFILGVFILVLLQFPQWVLMWLGRQKDEETQLQYMNMVLNMARTIQTTLNEHQDALNQYTTALKMILVVMQNRPCLLGDDLLKKYEEAAGEKIGRMKDNNGKKDDPK